MSTPRERTRTTTGTIWSEEIDLAAAARRPEGQRYRFPRTPRGMRLGEIQLRFDETVEGSAKFRTFCDRLERVTHRRTPEAVIMRAIRRYVVAHQAAFLEVARTMHVRGRVITEEDVEEILERTWGEVERTAAAAPEGELRFEPDASAAG